MYVCMYKYIYTGATFIHVLLICVCNIYTCIVNLPPSNSLLMRESKEMLCK